MAVNKNISELKRAGGKNTASFKDKEILLKEVHHRVLNNLQVISSLLDMMSMRSQNQREAELFENALSKIHAIALVHSKLYKSDSFDQIDMGDYSRELLEYLERIHGMGQMVLTNVIEHAKLFLSLTQAIPYALVLSEAIANAFKHAFRERQTGSIEISIKRPAHDTALISIKDDGMGLPDGIDIKHIDSLGFLLMRDLVQDRLKGTIRFERDEGTKITIEFKTKDEG
jgi:two-component sensor histidine kinase